MQPTLRDFREAIHQLPQSLDETYNDVWSRIVAQPATRSHLAQKIICWISCARRQLTTEELLHALAIRSKDSDLDKEGLVDQHTCLQCCQGLVTIDSNGKIVRLVHESAQQYFDRTCSEKFPNAQTELADAWLTYLMFNKFQTGPTEFSSPQ